MNISGTANEAVRETTGSLNGSAHEGGSASACDSVVKIRLSTEDGGVGEARSIRNVLLKVDVRCEDGARARRAKFARIGGRGEEKERKTSRAEGRGIRDERSGYVLYDGRTASESRARLLNKIVLQEIEGVRV